MGFNLLAFAGGAAKSITEQIEKQEEEVDIEIETRVYEADAVKTSHRTRAERKTRRDKAGRRPRIRQWWIRPLRHMTIVPINVKTKEN